jgi:hypothetical protein
MKLKNMIGIKINNNIKRTILFKKIPKKINIMIIKKIMKIKINPMKINIYKKKKMIAMT